MSELDKYFEKARNVEPIYEEDDARKLLYGKLRDGGIATNLYNKIKVFPMITALITSVATIATIAFFSMTSPNEVKEKPSTQKHTTVSSVTSTADTVELKEKKITTRSIIANNNIIDENEAAKTKEKVKSKTWTDDSKIDIKSVNSLKLTKDELAQLGIVIDDKSFKVNAFDKYTYTINQNNEKTRDYYNKDEDHDALPTPAMVTTSTGFKTLTLFKKGNVEAVVDRYKSTNNGDTEYTTNVEQNIKTDDANIDIKVDKVENDSRELSSNSDLNYVVDGDTVSVKYAKKTDTSERSLSIKFPKGYEDIKDLDSHKERLDGLVNSFDVKGVATAFRKKDPNERKDTLLAKVDFGYVKSDFFDKSFDVVEKLVNALSGNPDLPYVLNHIDRIRGLRIDYQDITFVCDFQQIIDKESKLFDFNKYHLLESFDMPLDSTKFDNPKYIKTFKVSWWGYPDFFDEKESLANNVNSDKHNNLFYNPKLRDSLQSATDSSLKNMINDIITTTPKSNSITRDLLQRKSDSLEVIEIYKESIINLDTSYDDSTVFEKSNDIHSLNKKGSSSTIDTIAENEYVIKSEEPIRIKIHNHNPNIKVINSEKFKIVGKDTIYEKSYSIDDITKPREITKEEKERMKKRGIKFYNIENVSSLTINNVEMQDSSIVNIKSKDSVINNNDDKKLANMSFDLFDYNINELIPIEISFDGVNTDFIVWYEATDDFLSKLPTKIKEKINPELIALTEQNDHCENEPIEKKETVMDVWSGCSGAIKEMKVFPNPTTSNSNVEFELQDSRVISIALFDLSGKLIKNVKSGMSLGKGNAKELLNLSGVNPGLYYVVVQSEKGEQALQRIIIE